MGNVWRTRGWCLDVQSISLANGVAHNLVGGLGTEWQRLWTGSHGILSNGGWSTTVAQCLPYLDSHGSKFMSYAGAVSEPNKVYIDVNETSCQRAALDSPVHQHLSAAGKPRGGEAPSQWPIGRTRVLQSRFPVVNTDRGVVRKCCVLHRVMNSA